MRQAPLVDLLLTLWVEFVYDKGFKLKDRMAHFRTLLQSKADLVTGFIEISWKCIQVFIIVYNRMHSILSDMLTINLVFEVYVYFQVLISLCMSNSEDCST